ncbi:MAG: MFS transporter, partial [Candidatus Dormiibacterota bacterium]
MPPPTSSRSARFALVAICVAYFMVVLDTTVTNVALPAIGRDLDVEISGLQWVAASYALTFASLLLTGGALSDRAGAKRAFGGGTLLFTVASAACSLAPSLPALAIARAAQGAGAALAVPASLAVLQEVFTEPGARARALGVWGGVAGIGAGAG